jgi:hypothetical protein
VNAGKIITVSRKEYDDDRHRLMSDSGNVVGFRSHPADETRLAALLKNEDARRMSYPIGNQEAHQRKVAEYLAKIRAEAELPEPKKTAADKAVQVAKFLLGETAIVTNAQKGRTYSGEILQVGEEYAVQKIGADRAIIHNLSKMPDPNDRTALLERLKDDKRVSISYDGGYRASLKVVSREREEERESAATR